MGVGGPPSGGALGVTFEVFFDSFWRVFQLLDGFPYKRIYFLRLFKSPLRNLSETSPKLTKSPQTPEITEIPEIPEI